MYMLLLWVMVEVIEFGVIDRWLVVVVVVRGATAAADGGVVLLLALLDVGVELEHVEDGLRVFSIVLLGDSAAGEEAGPLLGEPREGAGDGIEADMHLVHKVGRVGDPHQG
jgi:hypothetical protein